MLACARLSLNFPCALQEVSPAFFCNLRVFFLDQAPVGILFNLFFGLFQPALDDVCGTVAGELLKSVNFKLRCLPVGPVHRHAHNVTKRKDNRWRTGFSTSITTLLNMKAFMYLRVKQRLLETLMMVHPHRPLSASLFHFIYIFSLVSCPFFFFFLISVSVVLFHVVENLY